jgi:nitronate monooxygenase
LTYLKDILTGHSSTAARCGRKWHGREQALEADLLAERPCYAAAAGGDFDTALVYTGEAIDMIHSVEPAAAIRLRAWPQGQPNA